MENTKGNKIGIYAFIACIALFGIFSGYVFFNNSSNLAITIRSNDDQLKREGAVNEALTRSLVSKNDTIKTLGNKILTIKSLQQKDSVAITKKDVQIKKLAHEKDSLLNLIHNYKWSDLEPVNSKPQ